MICAICRNKHICRVSYLLQNTKIIAEIQKCPYFSDDTKDFQYNTNTMEKPFKRRSMDEVMDVAVRIREMSEANKIKTLKVSPPTCEECKDAPAETECSQCGKKLCESCAVYEVGANKVYCEKCYDKAIPE